MKIPEDKKINLMRQMQCAFTCSDGAGRATTTHVMGCPFWVSAFPPCDYLASTKNIKKGEK